MSIKKAGIPTVQITLSDKIDLGEEFMRWEIASATAAAVIGVDPFVQPAVQESKDNTSRMLAEFARSKKLPSQTPIAEKGKLALFSGGCCGRRAEGRECDFRAMLAAFMNLAQPGDYFADDGVRVAKSHRGQGDRRDSQSGHRTLRRRDDVRLRPAMPAFDGTVAQGRSEHRAVPANHAGPSRLDCDSRKRRTISRSSTRRSTWEISSRSRRTAGA